MKIAIHACSAAKRNVNVNPRHCGKGRWICACNSLAKRNSIGMKKYQLHIVSCTIFAPVH